MNGCRTYSQRKNNATMSTTGPAQGRQEPLVDALSEQHFEQAQSVRCPPRDSGPQAAFLEPQKIVSL
jgi:hypothetical protein